MDIQLIDTVVVPQSDQHFVVREHFREDSDEVSVGWMGHYFKKNFLDLVERDVQEKTLQVAGNSGISVPYDMVLRELSEGPEASLFHVWSLLKGQPGGQSGGVLLVNGTFNIFFVSDLKLTWAVSVRFREEYWSIAAVPAGDRNLLPTNARILYAL